MAIQQLKSVTQAFFVIILNLFVKHMLVYQSEGLYLCPVSNLGIHF